MGWNVRSLHSNCSEVCVWLLLLIWCKYCNYILRYKFQNKIHLSNILDKIIKFKERDFPELFRRSVCIAAVMKNLNDVQCVEIEYIGHH